MAYVLIDDTLEQIAVVDRLAENTAALAIQDLRSPSLMDLDFASPGIVITSPIPDQSMSSPEFVFKPEDLENGSPRLIPISADLNTDSPRLVPISKGLGLGIFNPQTVTDAPGDTDEAAEYFREPYIEEDGPAEYLRPAHIDRPAHIEKDEPEEYFRPAHIEEDEREEYFRPAYIEEDEEEEYFRPAHIEEEADEPEEFFRPAYTEDDKTEKLLRSVESWLGGVRSPATPPWQKSGTAKSGIHPISLLNEPFHPQEEGAVKEPCALGSLLGIITPQGCLGCGGKHSITGIEVPVFDFAPHVELPPFNPFTMM